MHAASLKPLLEWASLDVPYLELGCSGAVKGRSGGLNDVEQD